MNSYIKVIGYRIFEDKKESKWRTKQEFFDRPYHFDSHQSLFTGIEGFLASLDPNEHYNLHYTLNHLPQGATTKDAFFKYDVIPFDLDTIDKNKEEYYIQLVEETLRVNRSEMVVVRSGSGLHFLIQLDKPIETVEELQSYKASYDSVCSVMEDKLKAQNLVIEKKIGGVLKRTNFDKGVFRIGTLRLPSTRNIKYDKKTGQKISDQPCEFITKFLTPKNITHLGLVSEDKLNTESFDPDKYWSKTDSEYIFNNCGALKEFKEKRGNVSYPQWFSAASIISRLNDINGPDEFHKISSGSKDYSQAETQKLIDDTLQSGGPHKCSTFMRSYDACSTCTLKCTTPLTLRSKKHLKYEEKGFHIYTRGVWNPYYKEMLVKVNQDYNYKVKGDNRELWIYDEDNYTWNMWPRNDFRQYISDLMSKKPGDLAKTQTKNELENQILDRNAIPENYFVDKSSGKINLKNGFLNINGDDLKFTLHSADSYREGFLYCLPFEYDPDAKAPMFTQFIKDICLEREDLETLLLEYIGYCLSNDDIWLHKAMVLKGEGANGKSVLLEIIKAMIGEGAYSILSLKQLQDVESRAQLINSIANISDETPKDSLFDAEEFKKLVGGGEFEYRILYKGKGMARNKAKFLFSSNNELHISDKSAGVRRRLIVMPLEANFDVSAGPLTKEPDPFIIDKLKTELSGIFNLCISKYMDAKKRRSLTTAEASEKLTQAMFDNSNPIKLYLEDTMLIDRLDFLKETKNAKETEEMIHDTLLSLDKNADYDSAQLSFVPINVMRADFEAFCSDHGYKTAFTSTNFSKEVTRIIGMRIGISKAELLKMRRRKREKAGGKIKSTGPQVRGMLVPWQPYADASDY